MGILDRVFKLTENRSDVKTEVLAGLTTFVTMAYIIVVNPKTLSATGMDEGALFMATILAAAVSTLVMGLVANWPVALAPGMGLNAFFAFTLVGGLGLSWQQALGAVLISGILALIVTATGLRELMIRAIPEPLKHAVTAGIGFFIMLIGLINAGIVTASEATTVALGDLSDPKTLLAVIGVIITGVLVARKVTGGILLGILITTVIGIPMGVTTMPESWVSAPPSLAPSFLKLSFDGLFSPGMITVIFAMFFADLFDTIGTFVGVASKAGMVDKEGNLKGGNRALIADSLGTIIGSLFGTSNTTTYVESAAGVTAGGRTGLTAITVAVLFLLASLFSGAFLAIPGQATAPALIIVGAMMASSITQIDLDDFGIALPAIITALMMPFTFSIAQGLALGFIAYAAIALMTGRASKVHWMMWVLAAFFIAHFTIEALKS
nr:NCS2 family permease [Symbiobacterium terraclitae]